MITTYLYALLIVVAVLGIALAPMLIRRSRRNAEVAKAFSYLRRSASGDFYITDPQTGTVHRLDNVLTKRIGRNAEKAKK